MLKYGTLTTVHPFHWILARPIERFNLGVLFSSSKTIFRIDSMSPDADSIGPRFSGNVVIISDGRGCRCIHSTELTSSLMKTSAVVLYVGQTLAAPLAAIDLNPGFPCISIDMVCVYCTHSRSLSNITLNRSIPQLQFVVKSTWKILQAALSYDSSFRLPRYFGRFHLLHWSHMVSNFQLRGRPCAQKAEHFLRGDSIDLKYVPRSLWWITIWSNIHPPQEPDKMQHFWALSVGRLFLTRSMSLFLLLSSLCFQFRWLLSVYSWHEIWTCSLRLLKPVIIQCGLSARVRINELIMFQHRQLHKYSPRLKKRNHQALSHCDRTIVVQPSYYCNIQPSLDPNTARRSRFSGNGFWLALCPRSGPA